LWLVQVFFVVFEGICQPTERFDDLGLRTCDTACSLYPLAEAFTDQDTVAPPPDGGGGGPLAGGAEKTIMCWPEEQVDPNMNDAWLVWS
jgi:hypothetical protein